MDAARLTPLAERYAVYEQIGAGGMATVHLARLQGHEGFARAVAIKGLHPHFANEEHFINMLRDEARLAARVRHVNVVPTLDVIATAGQVFIVMEYVHGESLTQLLRIPESAETITPAIASGIIGHVLLGLHAAHEARDDRGEPLEIVHRDVSPQNVLIGTDGVARILDFGVAKATGRLTSTRDGEIKGKLAYMSPEQLRGEHITRQSDVYAAAVLLWELLAKRRLHAGENEGNVIEKILFSAIDPPSMFAPEGVIPPGLDAVVMRGLSHERSDRFPTALAMATALSAAMAPAEHGHVGAWVEAAAYERLTKRARWVAEIESSSSTTTSTSSALSSLPANISAAEATTDEPASEIRTIDVDVTDGGPRAPKDAKRRGRRVAIIAMAGAAGLLVAGIVLQWIGQTRSQSSQQEQQQVAVASSASVSPLVSGHDPREPATATALATAVAPLVVAPTSSGEARPAGRASRIGASPRKDCDPPYTRDGDGRKIWKRDCWTSR